MVTHNEPRSEIPRLMARRFVIGPEDESRDDRVLMLEVAAEATRSDTVAQILREADRRLRAKGQELVQRSYPELSERHAVGLVELLAVLAEGTALRRVTGLRGDKETLIGVYQEVMEKVFATAEKTA